MISLLSFYHYKTVSLSGLYAPMNYDTPSSIEIYDDCLSYCTQYPHIRINLLHRVDYLTCVGYRCDKKGGNCEFVNNVAVFLRQRRPVRSFVGTFCFVFKISNATAKELIFRLLLVNCLRDPSMFALECSLAIQTVSRTDFFFLSLQTKRRETSFDS